nr:choice-of-anchor D domain-containing protein [Candidatus Neomarinimicrobiota bacterium]
NSFPSYNSRKKNITLLGNGMFGPDKTTIQGINAPLIPGISVNYSQGWTIRGFEIISVQHTVGILNCQDIEISQIYGHENFGSGNPVGVALQFCDNVNLHHNIFENNPYTGAWISNSTNTHFINNTIVYSQGNGVLILGPADPGLELVNNIIAFNADDGIESVSNQSFAIAIYNDVFGNGGAPWINVPLGIGNISLNPLFTGIGEMPYELQENSPCIDTGDPASPLDPDNTRADIGALYFHQGPQPIITLSTDSLLFPTTSIGTSSEMSLTIYNIGELNLEIFNITTGEPEVFYTDWVSSDSIIVPGDSLTITVTFSPLQSTLYTDFLTIDNNDQTEIVYLDGPVPLPDISVSADSLIFPNTLMGSSSELPLTIFNNGNGDLILYNMTVGDPDIFTLSWNPDDSLVTPGDSLSIIVQFLPLVSTLYIDHLIIDNNDVPVDVYLKGLEENAGASVSLYPHVLNIQIPSGGGSFNFDVEIINPVDEVVVDFWSSATLPGGGEFPIYVRNNLTLQAGEIILREDLTQTVPASAPSGMYSYNAYLKDHFTWEILSEDFFSFEKVPGESSPNHNFGWELFGWDGEVAPSGQIPSKITLDASPNPFNPETTLRYNLPESGDVRIAAYDVLGREAAVLFEGFNSSGQHELNWNAVDLSSGIYFVHLTSNNNNSIKRVLLVK